MRETFVISSWSYVDQSGNQVYEVHGSNGANAGKLFRALHAQCKAVYPTCTKYETTSVIYDETYSATLEKLPW